MDSADALSQASLYHFWNLGLRPFAACGSDFPWAAVPGSPRFYTYVNGELTAEKYLESLKNRHTFTSKGGTFIDIRANEELPGSVLKVSTGDKIKIRFSAAINPEFDALDRVEIVKLGKVVETIKSEEGGGLWLEHEMEIDASESCWIAARVFGKQYSEARTAYGGMHPSCAHTTPFFVEVDDKPFERSESFIAEVDTALDALRKLEKMVVEGHKEIDAELMAGQKQRLLDYIEQARANFENMRKSESVEQ